MSTTVVALFRNVEDANQAIGALKTHGVADSQISFLAREKIVGHLAEKVAVNDEVNKETTEGAAVGAVGGASLGMFAGLMAGIGSLVIPGVGPVIAGSALATLFGASAAGAGVGAVTGGALLGGLVKTGVANEDIDIYAEGIKRGGILLAASVDPEQVDTVTRLMYETGAIDTENLRQEWKAEGWEKFDDSQEPASGYPTLTIL